MLQSLICVRSAFFVLRADTQVRPYDDNDAVHVIRHENVSIQFDLGKFFLCLVPPTGHHPSRLIQNHLVFDDVAEKTLPVLRANRHEITSGLRVIVSCQTIRFSTFWAGVHVSRMPLPQHPLPPVAHGGAGGVEGELLEVDRIGRDELDLGGLGEGAGSASRHGAGVDDEHGGVALERVHP